MHFGESDVLGISMSAWLRELNPSDSCFWAQCREGHAAAGPLNAAECCGGGKLNMRAFPGVWGMICTDQSCSVSAASHQHPTPLRLRYLRPLLALRVKHVLALHVLTP